jgi:hypothetical protein
MTLHAVQVTLAVAQVIEGECVVRHQNVVDVGGVAVITRLTVVALVRVLTEAVSRWSLRASITLRTLIALTAE